MSRRLTKRYLWRCSQWCRPKRETIPARCAPFQRPRPLSLGGMMRVGMEMSMTDAIPVTVENFARAETDRMFAACRPSGGVNALASRASRLAGRSDSDQAEPRHAVHDGGRRHLRRGHADVAGRRGQVPVGDGRERGPLHQPGLPLPPAVRADAGRVRHRPRCWWRPASWSTRPIPTTSQRSTPCRTRSSSRPPPPRPSCRRTTTRRVRHSATRC